MSDDTQLQIDAFWAGTPYAVAEAIALGICNIWLQPGAESEAVLRIAAKAGGINLIAGGPCVLVVLGFSAAL